MNKEKSVAKILYQIAAIGFYIAALGFFIAAIVGNNLSYTPVGTGFMCLGTLFLVISKRVSKNDKDSRK